MAHPLVEQLRFTRDEWLRGLETVTPEDGSRRFEPMNSISWMVGHLAWHEQRSWLRRAQGKTLVSAVKPCGSGQPPSTPPLAEMWAAWHTITQASDEYLDTLTSDQLQQHFSHDRDQQGETVGTVLRRVTYHYWYHLGEGLAVRQLLGHADLPQFVGDIGGQAPYRPE